MREMKDSGIEWIGKIGQDFVVRRLKYLAYNLDECRKPISADKRSQNSDELYDYYGASGKIDKIDGFTIDDHVMLIGEDGANLRMRNLPLMYEVSGKAWVNNHAHILKPKDGVNFRFLFHALESLDINPYITGSAQPKLNQESLNNMWVAIPSFSEQRRIASYLDRKCSEIDDLVADIEKQIETLEQYKRSVITEAVTKGLKRDVEMKDSGVEWIGKVPNHWQIKRIKHLFSLRAEKNYKPLEEVQLLSLYTGIGVFPHGEREERGNKAVKAEGYSIVKKNDIVVNIILAWMGAIGISDYDGVTSPAYDVYKPNSDMTNPRFYHYVFQTQGIASECYRYGRGIMMMRWRTYSSEFKQIQIPFPPVTEQQTIADYLDSKCAEIESIIADKQTQLDTLAEYKKSLIYEYVTGKKEVEVDE